MDASAVVMALQLPPDHRTTSLGQVPTDLRAAKIKLVGNYLGQKPVPPG